MSSKSVNIVWLKRDLRSQDHAPLLKAECAGIPYRIIYLFEPSRIEYPDTSPRHLQFVYHSIVALNKLLSEFNRRVEVFLHFDFLQSVFQKRMLVFSFFLSSDLNLYEKLYSVFYWLTTDEASNTLLCFLHYPVSRVVFL